MSRQLVDHSFIADWNDDPWPTSNSGVDYVHRALTVWPGLDSGPTSCAPTTTRCASAGLVSHTTSVPLETILVLLCQEDRRSAQVMGASGSQNQNTDPPPGRSR